MREKTGALLAAGVAAGILRAGAAKTGEVQTFQYGELGRLAQVSRTGSINDNINLISKTEPSAGLASCP